jgi:multidrug efflux pump
MQLPEICIKRPVFATVLSLIILLVGLISYTRLAVREYPRIDEPERVDYLPRRVGRSR